MLKLKIPPALVFLICVALMWGLDQWLSQDILEFETPDWVSDSLLVIGGLVIVLGVMEFARKSTTVNPHKPQNTTAFVKSGVYRFTRNPMYLGMIFIMAAGIAKLGNVLTVLVIPLFIWYMNVFQIGPEEEMLQQKFGDKFKRYKKEVRRWI